MKLRIFIVIVAVVLAWIAGRSIKSGGESIIHSAQQEARGSHAHGEETPREGESSRGGSERRINESYELADGAQVDVHGINGPVTVEAVDGNTAEISVTSTAKSMSDLDANQIVVEHTASSLVVRGKGSKRGGFWKWLRGAGGGEVRHNVVLKLPRRVELVVGGINGRVKVGEMEGSAEVSGVNGRVEIGVARGFAEVNGVNGGVALTIRELNENGLKVNGINGGVELRLDSDVKADVDINGVIGHMTVEAPNVEVQEQKRDKLRARIGTGGANIEVNGVNGGVRLVGV